MAVANSNELLHWTVIKQERNKTKELTAFTTYVILRHRRLRNLFLFMENENQLQ